MSLEMQTEARRTLTVAETTDRRGREEREKKKKRRRERRAWRLMMVVPGSESSDSVRKELRRESTHREGDLREEEE